MISYVPVQSPQRTPVKSTLNRQKQGMGQVNHYGNATYYVLILHIFALITLRRFAPGSRESAVDWKNKPEILPCCCVNVWFSENIYHTFFNCISVLHKLIIHLYSHYDIYIQSMKCHPSYLFMFWSIEQHEHFQKGVPLYDISNIATSVRDIIWKQ